MENTNILVLENVSHLDEQFSVYLNKYHGENNLDIVYELAHERKNIDLIPHFAKADTLAVCSSFANRGQLCQMLEVLEKFENIKRIEIMFLYTRNNNAFSEFLYEFKHDYPDHFKIIQKLVDTREVVEIYHTCYETKQEYFSKLEYTYDVVQLYNVPNSKYEIIFPVRQPISYWHDKYYFRDHIQTIVDNYDYYYENLKDLLKYINEKREKLESKNKIISLSSSDIKKLKSLFSEFSSIVENRNEKLDEGKFFDEDEIKTLRKDNNSWLKIIDKISKQI